MYSRLGVFKVPYSGRKYSSIASQSVQISVFFCLYSCTWSVRQLSCDNASGGACWAKATTTFHETVPILCKNAQFRILNETESCSGTCFILFLRMISLLLVFPSFSVRAVWIKTCLYSDSVVLFDILFSSALVSELRSSFALNLFPGFNFQR